MKKIIAISYFIVVCMAFVSCTNDDDTIKTKEKMKVSAEYPGDSGGDQTGQIPVPRPK
ncbi:hypothetical protein OIU83_22470 [Flavobacterium sp. LS1R49]|uniref:Lipoprotein n=1 Tax=Flavobacterium shii TaxID=2987687 RepID=A0A9X2ZIJ7_9FLAO|nr:hypothetical protein [Flavobacterium shii]MCV9930442.1 hypothetical protein [Flavobacterium shii]